MWGRFFVSEACDVTEIRFDTSDFEQLGRAFLNLPGAIKAKVFASAMRRMRDMARTRVTKLGADRIDAPVGKIRQRTTAFFNAGSSTIEVVEKSGWFSLLEIDPGARQTRVGVSVRLRGSYRHAFLGQMASSHKGVMRRVGKERLPIRELFGPNPAHDITNNPEDYLDLMDELISNELLPRIVHELDRQLPR